MRLICLWMLACFGFAGAEPLNNWTANYAPCHRHSELQRRGPMSLGVRIVTANPLLAEQFRSAMNFWAKVVVLDWHDEDSKNCSIELVDGQRDLFEPVPDNMVARSQFPDRGAFQGWIVFNPAVSLTKTEMYRIAVHEIGHVLGLRHSPNTRSLMYGLDLECSEFLDAADLASLASRHKLRVAPLMDQVSLTTAQ